MTTSDHPDTPEPRCPASISGTCLDLLQGFGGCPEGECINAPDEVRVTALSASDIASAEEGIAMASRIEPVAVTPEGGQPDADDELLARADDYLAIAPPYPGRPPLTHVLVRDLASALRRKREQLEWFKVKRWEAEADAGKAERELAEARSHGEAIFEGAITGWNHERLEIRVDSFDPDQTEPWPGRVLVVRATADQEETDDE